MPRSDNTPAERDGTALIDASAPQQTQHADLELIGRRATARRSGVPGPPPTTMSAAAARLRANLRDEVVRFLLGALLVAQVADLVTTHIALGGSALMERNPLFRPLFQSLPGLADGVKLGAVLLMALLAMSALSLPRSRHALLLAAGISLVAPIANLMLMAGRV